ncbi:response regulator [Parvibaculum sp.]|uniref:response regulator n=1 Tax=Parvibaculum sp. TaxID=2024848 RepID=UPI00271CC4FA|nr:response regulator [Parvibaculum sp.]MDO9125303.1 response regulator [Parvibaculum sp.]MDP1625762.1 response regulator [Parvibaculum sp.]MDP2149125.1 response regulator [Parvibaculum sp.]MDP3328336.1 response regulator [Parvibaculum sp.]
MARILVAEDEPDVRTFVMRALGGAGHDVDAVADGSDALEALARARTANRPHDLLLTDILMPVMDGVSLALLAARDAPSLRIMLMTGYSGQRERAHGLDAIIQDILLKPFTLDELVTRVAAVLEDKTA